jgi:cytoskeletal protein CcmA (bactofilin family)
MSAAAPPTSVPGVPSTRSATAPRAGRLRDVGSVRRASVRSPDWTARGTTKVQGDVEVDTGTVVGLTSVGGKLTAGSFRASGTFEVVGPTDTRETLTLDGTVHLQSAVHAGTLDVRGTLRCGAELRVDRVLTIAGSIEAPSAQVGLLDLTGSAEIPGELTAIASVRGRFRGDSEIGAVRAKTVKLEGPPTALLPTLLRTVFGGSGVVHVGRIEADAVELSAVTVEFVRSNAIVLGPGCHVREVEGTIVRRHPSSRVGPESRSPPPHGLSR